MDCCPDLCLPPCHHVLFSEQQAGGSSTPLRHTSDVAMSEPPAGTDAAARAAGAAADDTHDSAFLQQHPFDNIERACAMDNLRHPSDTSDAATAAPVAAAARAAAAAAAAGAGAEVANANKRGRGAAEELAPAGAAGPRTLYHSESECQSAVMLWCAVMHTLCIIMHAASDALHACCVCF